MTLTCMTYGRIRDLVSNFGWKENDNMYVLGSDCLNALESVEEELLNEDVVSRNVHISLHMCEVVKKDLIPILRYVNNDKVIAAATRVLMHLTQPVESFLQLETAKPNNVQKLLYSASFEIRKSFLDEAATFPVVSMLREAMLKVEKQNKTLDDDECNHIKSCLFLLKNLLQLPEESDSAEFLFYNFQEWQFVQNKLIWNLFVHGLDGALLLLLNSRYRIHWTIPLSYIITLLYKNQNISKVHEALELISSSSDASADEEESDGSKNSSMSLSSETSKPNNNLSDSGCVLTSDTCNKIKFTKEALHKPTNDESTFDIHTKLEMIQISDDSEPQHYNFNTSYDKPNPFVHSHDYQHNDSESSSSFESPSHKRIKGNNSFHDQGFMSESTDSSNKGLGINMHVDLHLSNSKCKTIGGNSEDQKLSIKNFKAVQKLRMQSKMLESDSSNEEIQNIKVKHRSHPPAGRRGKSPRRNSGCTPSICMESALAASESKGRIKYPLCEKRNSVTTLVDNASPAPSDEDIGNLIKEFTMCFLHSGFSDLVQDIKDLLLDKQNASIDKSLLFWILSYFLHLASTVHVNINHMSKVLSPEFISYLVYECVIACENIEVHFETNPNIRKYLTVQLGLVVAALKEIFIAIDQYSRKSGSQKDRAFFSNLYGNLSSLQHLKYLPLLLFYNSHHVDSKSFLEDVVILNHYILVAFEKATDLTQEDKQINLVCYLKHFCNQNIMNSYGILLENYKYNSNFLNECIFTMMHHIAGDIHASDYLIQPTILKSFSSILKEENDLEPYQEDLIMYILNKFSRQVQKKHSKKINKEGESSEFSDHSSTSISSINSKCLLSEDDDDLFWWYLQFEQDKDPITRISEHIPTSKRDILSKLQMKGIILPEVYENLVLKMEGAEKQDNELLTCEDLVEMESFDDEITHLLRTLVQCGGRQHLIWLQEKLLETCYVKLGSSNFFPEPIPFYSIRMMTPIPLVPYTADQRTILKDELFMELLKKIGFQIGNNLCPIYPRIPLMWTADVLFNIAARLGPMRKDKLNFSYDELLLANPVYNAAISNPPTLPPLSSCTPLSSWMTVVQRNKEEKKPFPDGKNCL